MTKDHNSSPTTRYNKAVQAIKQTILRGQLEAVRAVNRQQLALYYAVGRYVSNQTRQGVWGSGAIDAISKQLRIQLPGLRGFGVSNIKNMRFFYEVWSPYIEPQIAAKCQETKISAGELIVDDKPENESVISFEEVSRVFQNPLAGELEWQDFLSLSFSHHLRMEHNCSKT